MKKGEKKQMKIGKGANKWKWWYRRGFEMATTCPAKNSISFTAHTHTSHREEPRSGLHFSKGTTRGNPLVDECRTVQACAVSTRDGGGARKLELQKLARALGNVNRDGGNDRRTTTMHNIVQSNFVLASLSENALCSFFFKMWNHVLVLLHVLLLYLEG